MNITTEPWIPIVWQNGQPDLASLTEAFARGHEIQDLAVRPHERIAVMRLLICIAQAALDGPADDDEWKNSAPRIGPSALDYLVQWQHAFELFGNGQRFLQASNLKKVASKPGDSNDEGNSISKLDVALATGNNSTLFDNAGGSERAFTPAQLALMLLTFECFSPGGTIGVALWNDGPTLGWSGYPKVKPGQSGHAPCIAASMLHALIRGQDLLETIHLNMLSKAQVAHLYGNARWGRPLWESPPGDPTDDDAVHNATATYLGRLVPLARAVRLDENLRTMILANGLKFNEWRESTATVVVRTVKGQPGRTVLRASLDKAAWRELHSLTVKAVSQTSNGGPLALQNLSGDQPFDLWVGGLVADQAKLLDTLESVFHVPAAMLTEPSQRAYEEGVAFSKAMEFRLRRAVSAYHKELGDDLDRAEVRDRRRQVQDKAMTQYWTDAERYVNKLLAVAENPALLGLDGAWQKTDWGRGIWRAALAAYDHACSHETARQIRAYALGRRALVAVPAAQQPRKETGS